MFKHSDTTTQDLAASARRLIAQLDDGGHRPAPRRPVHVHDVPGQIEAARRALAHARAGSLATVVSDARTVLATIERFFALAPAVAAWHVFVPEARAMALIAHELLEIHASAAVRGVL